MNISSDEMFVMVFKRVMRDNLEEFSLDSHMFKVLMELDGKRSLAAVTEKIGLNMGTMRRVISKLLELKLIEPIQSTISTLDKDFFDGLCTQLSLAVGPIAEILIEDAVIDLGYSLSQVPDYRAAELVDLLGQQIQREDKRIDFKHNMVKQIREKG